MFLNSGCLNKLNHDRDWVSQRILVSRSNLYMTALESSDLKDLIPLHEVTAVSALSRRNRTGAADDEWRNIIAGDGDCVHPFEVKTEATGYNSGRSYVFGASSEEVRDEWIRCLESASKESRLLAMRARDGKIMRFRRRVKTMYESRPVQYLTALLIMGNFFANVMQAEKNPAPGSPQQSAFDTADFAFTGEIRIYIYSHVNIVM